MGDGNLVYGTNAFEKIDVLDGVTSGYDLICGYGGNDSIFGAVRLSGITDAKKIDFAKSSQAYTQRGGPQVGLPPAICLCPTPPRPRASPPARPDSSF
jgi:hypothetical protein